MKISATLRCGPGARYVARTASDSLERVTSRRSEVRKSSSLMPSSWTCASSVASTTGATISDTWPTRNTPSAPSMTPVGVSSAAANSASTNGASSAALSSMNPRSPPCSLVASVETLFATSSNDVPALRSASALAAARLGRGDRRPVGLGRALGDGGLHRDHPRVTELRGRRLLGEAGVDVGVGDGHALLRRELLHDPAVDQLLERDRRGLLVALLERLRGAPARRRRGSGPR